MSTFAPHLYSHLNKFLDFSNKIEKTLASLSPVLFDPLAESITFFFLTL